MSFSGSSQGERYLYKWAQPDACLVKTGKGPKLGECNTWGAKRWSLKHGKLAHDGGKSCLVRNHDNTGGEGGGS